MAMDLKDYKELSCKEFRPNCDFTVRAEIEEEVLKKYQEHACSTHGRCVTSPEIEKRIKSHIRGIRV